LAGGWWLVLNWCERKALLAGNQPAEPDPWATKRNENDLKK
jgi:hypothetical protein